MKNVTTTTDGGTKLKRGTVRMFTTDKKKYGSAELERRRPELEWRRLPAKLRNSNDGSMSGTTMRITDRNWNGGERNFKRRSMKNVATTTDQN